MRRPPLLPLLLAGLPLLAGCPKELPPPAEPFGSAGQAEAAEIVSAFFEAYVRADLDEVLARICEEDDGYRVAVADFVRTSQQPGSRFRVERFEVGASTAMWDGRTPYFLVDVAFPRPGDEVPSLHSYRVRAREGCVESLLGASPRPKAPAHPTAPANPNAPEEKPAPAAKGEDDEVIKL